MVGNRDRLKMNEKSNQCPKKIFEKSSRKPKDVLLKRTLKKYKKIKIQDFASWKQIIKTWEVAQVCFRLLYVFVPYLSLQMKPSRKKLTGSSSQIWVNVYYNVVCRWMKIERWIERKKKLKDQSNERCSGTSWRRRSLASQRRWSVGCSTGRGYQASSYTGTSENPPPQNSS